MDSYKIYGQIWIFFNFWDSTHLLYIDWAYDKYWSTGWEIRYKNQGARFRRLLWPHWARSCQTTSSRWPELVDWKEGSSLVHSFFAVHDWPVQLLIMGRINFMLHFLRCPRGQAWQIQPVSWYRASLCSHCNCNIFIFTVKQICSTYGSIQKLHATQGDSLPWWKEEGR